MRLFLFFFACGVLVPTAAGSADIEQARALVKKGQLAEAASILERATQADPTNAEAQFLFGQIHLERRQSDPVKRTHYEFDRNDTKRALVCLEKAVALAPQNSRYHRVLAETYHRASKEAGIFSRLSYTKKAHRLHERAVELAPDDLEARWSRMMFYHQAPPPVGGGVAKAFAEAEEIKRRDVKRGRLALATLHALENQPLLAFAQFEETLAETPSDYVALYHVGRLAATTGLHLERGLAALRRCLELTPPPDAADHANVHWRIGDILVRQHDRTGARLAYIAALHERPDHREALAALAALK